MIARRLPWPVMVRSIGCAGLVSARPLTMPLCSRHRKTTLANCAEASCARHEPALSCRTHILETEFQTETGRAAVIDFMPLGDGADLVRIVIGRSGRVSHRACAALQLRGDGSMGQPTRRWHAQLHCRSGAPGPANARCTPRRRLKNCRRVHG
jgi:hypothetical protein